MGSPVQCWDPATSGCRAPHFTCLGLSATVLGSAGMPSLTPRGGARRRRRQSGPHGPRPSRIRGAPGKCGVVSRNQGTGGLSAVLAPDRAGGWRLGDEAGARHPRRGRSHRTRLRVSTLPTGSANRSRGTPRWGLQGRLEPLWGGCPWLPGVVSSSGEASGGDCGTPELFQPGPPALFLPLPA